MFEDKLKDALNLSIHGKNAPPKGEEEQGQAIQRQKQTKRILEGFGVELESLIVLHEDSLQERIESVFDSNYGTVQVNQECQTEIRNAISRNLDLQIIHEKPFNYQSTRPPSLDVEVQTDVT